MYNDELGQLDYMLNSSNSIEKKVFECPFCHSHDFDFISLSMRAPADNQALKYEYKQLTDMHNIMWGQTKDKLYVHRTGQKDLSYIVCEDCGVEGPRSDNYRDCVNEWLEKCEIVEAIENENSNKDFIDLLLTKFSAFYDFCYLMKSED